MERTVEVERVIRNDALSLASAASKIPREKNERARSSGMRKGGTGGSSMAVPLAVLAHDDAERGAIS